MHVMFGQVGIVSSQTGMHYMYTLSEEAIAMSTQVKEDELSFPDTFENANVFFYGEWMQNLAEKFKSPPSREKNLQFIKLRQIRPSYTL